MSVKFPDDLQLIFICQSISVQNDGVAESVIRKIKFIEDYWGHRPILLTSDYNIHLAYIGARLSGEGKEERQTRFNPDTRVLGVFDYFSNSYPYNLNLEAVTHPMRGDKTLTYTKISGNSFDVFKDDQLIRREHYGYPGGGLSKIDLLDDDKKINKSFVYDYLGYMTKVTLWDTDKPGYHPAEFYYTTDKKVRIRADYGYIEKPENSKIFSTTIYKTPNELIKYTLFDNDGNEIGSVPTHEHLMALCIDGLTSDPGMKYIVCDECHLFGSAGFIYPKKNVANATVIHNIFLDDPYNLKSDPQSYYKHVCDNRRKFDAIIHLTNECKRDFEKKYEPSNRNYVITHPYPFPVERAGFELRDHKKAVVTSRLFPQKRLNLAVEIFALVVKEVPDAKLDIYGFGPLKDKLQEQINELGIGDNVKLKGYTDKATKIMSESACFLMTSFAEGLGLVLLECISNGCPAFAHDVKYGPSHIIKNKVTGFLFKDRDKRNFARQLIQFFNDMDMQKRMSENCYEDAPRFSVDVFMDKYWEMTEKLYNRMKK